MIIWLSGPSTPLQVNYLEEMLECCPTSLPPTVGPARQDQLQSVAAAAHQIREPRSVSLSQTEHQYRRDERERERERERWCPQSRPEFTVSQGKSSTSPGSPSPARPSPGGCRRSRRSWSWRCPGTRGPGPGRRWRGGWRVSAPGTACLSPARTGSWWTGRRCAWWRPPCSATEFPWEGKLCTETSRSDWRKLWITSKIITPSASSPYYN